MKDEIQEIQDIEEIKEEIKKKRGRPKGSKNKETEQPPVFEHRTRSKDNVDETNILNTPLKDQTQDLHNKGLNISSG